MVPVEEVEVLLGQRARHDDPLRSRVARPPPADGGRAARRRESIRRSARPTSGPPSISSRLRRPPRQLGRSSRVPGTFCGSASPEVLQVDHQPTGRRGGQPLQPPQSREARGGVARRRGARQRERAALPGPNRSARHRTSRGRGGRRGPSSQKPRKVGVSWVLRDATSGRRARARALPVQLELADGEAEEAVPLRAAPVRAARCRGSPLHDGSWRDGSPGRGRPTAPRPDRHVGPSRAEAPAGTQRRWSCITWSIRSSPADRRGGASTRPSRVPRLPEPIEVERRQPPVLAAGEEGIGWGAARSAEGEEPALVPDVEAAGARRAAGRDTGASPGAAPRPSSPLEVERLTASRGGASGPPDRVLPAGPPARLGPPRQTVPPAVPNGPNAA